MPKRTHVQRDFSGGEISTRMLMRAETDVYQKSLLEMENFQPGFQGSAERSPGSRFAYDTGKTNVRLIPYLTPANESGFVELSQGELKIRKQLIDLLGTITSVPGNQPVVNNQPGTSVATPYRKQIVPNGDFLRNADGWVMDPEEYVGGAGDLIGLRWTAYLQGYIRGQARIWKPKDSDTCTVTSTAEVDEPTVNSLIQFRLEYFENFANDPDAGFECTVKVGKSPGASDVLDWTFDGDVGDIREESINVSLDGGNPWTGTLYIQTQWKATTNKSAPLFRLFYFYIWADGVIDIEDDEIGGETPPWTWPELDDIHFIQSPYSPPPDRPNAPSKQLVLVHPNHIPHMLFFNSDANLTLPPTYPNPGDIPVGYVLLKCVFDNPPPWTAGNYPNTCASFNGRLILAGAQDAPVLGSPTSPDTETVWGTVVGNWLAFSGPDDVDPDDSIEFTSIYRSPIQWVYGQKQLLVGATEMEYSASADRIFSPGDLGVEMHSTHGSNHVQPTGFGKSVLFPADAGTKVRELMFQNEDRGWVAPDLTLLHPELCISGIRRMVRVRNPHQMLIVLLGSGQLALLHQDAQANVFGWSRLALTKGTRVKDICVVRNAEGEDIPFISVFRNIDGQSKLYVESIPNWVNSSQWEYTLSSVKNIPNVPQHTFGGFDHVEGKWVQVVADGNYEGSFLVQGGQIRITDAEGNPKPVSSIVAGLPMTSRMRTLPVPSSNPGAFKRFTAVKLRIRQSTRPLINGVRPAERSPATQMGRTEGLDEFEDVEVTKLETDLYQVITVEENVPLRTEILGLYGELQEDSL